MTEVKREPEELQAGLFGDSSDYSNLEITACSYWALTCSLTLTAPLPQHGSNVEITRSKHEFVHSPPVWHKLDHPKIINPKPQTLNPKTRIAGIQVKVLQPEPATQSSKS